MDGAKQTDSKTTVAELRELVRKFRRARGWDREKNSKNLAISLVLEAVEHLEHYQWLETHDVEQDKGRRREVAYELVDVLYWVVTIADAYKIDLSKTLKDKLKQAAKRYPEKEFPKGLSYKEVLKRSFRLQKRGRGQA